MQNRPYLYPLSLLYDAVVSARSAAYQKGYFKSSDLGAPTISIGNITVGGTGKTPLTASIAEMLYDRGERVCILTRGYGRKDPRSRVVVSDGSEVLADAGQSGDEPFELAQRLKGKASIIADANRVEAAKWAMANLKPNVFLLDDGFQHMRVKRDLNIAVIDATNPFGNGKLLPQGILREPMEALIRADMIVLSRSNLADAPDIESLKTKLVAINPNASLFNSENKITDIVPLDNMFAANLNQSNSDKSFFAFCGLGNPTTFFEQLDQQGIQVAAAKIFRDHHKYSQNDIDLLEKDTRGLGADALITTIKDAVKLSSFKFEVPCFAARLGITISENDAFQKQIFAALKK